MNHLPQLGLLLFSLLLVGCETVSSTAQYYRPFTTDTYPPKPKGSTMPILGAKPKRKFVTIGSLSFSAGHGYGYMIRAIEYNARRVGADAAIMRSTNSKSEQYSYTVPGRTTYQPVTTYTRVKTNVNYYGSGGSGYGSAYGRGTSTTNVPQYTPGYTGVRTVVRHSIDAIFIRFQ